MDLNQTDYSQHICLQELRRFDIRWAKSQWKLSSQVLKKKIQIRTCELSDSPKRWWSHQFRGLEPSSVASLWLWCPHTHKHRDRNPAGGCTAGWRGPHSPPTDSNTWFADISDLRVCNSIPECSPNPHERKGTTQKIRISWKNVVFLQINLKVNLT